jgi:Zn-dependent protease with chaperone function
MSLDSRLFVHEKDLSSLEALKAIPGFTSFVKSFMKNWNEKQFRIQNMSSRLRISKEQLPKYYAMLEDVCEKMEIDVPEIYLELNVVPNAYTYGDDKPFIVVTSGLIETIPDELIPSVLAHECGHIVHWHKACGKYHTHPASGQRTRAQGLLPPLWL